MSNPYGSLVHFLSRYKWRYVMGVAALITTDCLSLVMPTIVGRFFEVAQTGTLTMSLISQYVGVILGVSLAIGVLRFAWRIFVFGTARFVEQDLRNTFFGQLEKLSPSFYHRNKTGDLMAMATNDLQAVRGIAGEGVLMGTDAIVMTLVTLGIMIWTVGWKLSLLAVLPLPILAVASTYMSRAIFTRSRKVQDTFGRISDITQENIAGMRVVKAYSQEAEQESVFDGANRQYLQRFMSMMRIQGGIEPLIQLLAGLCYVLALVFPGRAVLRGEIDLGHFVSLTMYIGMMIWPMLAGGWVVNIIQRGMAAFDRIKGVITEEPAVQTAPGARMPAAGAIHGQIEIRNLTFTYADKVIPALKGISLTVNPGETLGILGRTGSGKTTLVSLLSRLFNPPRGTLFVDGVDVLDLPLDQLRHAIAFVPQDSFLFSRTVGENIGFAPGDWTEEQVRGAARTAQVEQDILEFLPEGYQTMVGERGVTLSGGQRQRVGLSRAVLKDAPILVLDDCLSAVDTATEARILGGLRPVMQDRTTVVISHRVTALRQADQIIVLDNGVIMESGAHDELIAQEGIYYRTWVRQQLEDAIASAE
ncbi:MAG TPA: ABC transporter ATP-binding protein [Symbiobacteriaceae bacterium]|nr:ABC transporter ATP-binding protein [Symbiobacteriaceae bacterium]